MTRKIDALAVEDARGVREVNPLEEARRGAFRPHVALDGHGGFGDDLFAAAADFFCARLDDDNLARLHVGDFARFEPEVEKGDAFARRGEEVAVERVAEGLDPVRIARDEHFAEGVEVDESVGAVETDRIVGMKNRFAANFDEIAFAFLNRRAKIMHEDFRVGIARETRVGVEL